MTETTSYGFDTLQIHAGARPDPATGARNTPIYQTTAYVFRDAEHAAALFNLQEVGYIYSRLTNPTVAVLQERIATLEGGAGAVCCSSGHAAQLIDMDDTAAVKAAIDDNTRAIFGEAIANPGGYIMDVRAIADIADDAGVPLIIDNTTATPYLCRPIEHGATLVVHSTTKYLTGNGSVTGGCVVDSGTFDWAASDKFPSLSQPEPAYHGLKFAETFGPLAYTFHGIAIGLRDLGMTMNPQAAHYTLMGIETLSLRMDRHVENATKLANWLEADDRVDYVTYAGLESSPYFHRVKDVCPRGASALFTFAVKGGYDACVKLVDSLEIFSHVANLGDARSLIIHSASTTHRQLTAEQQKAAGAAPEVVRVSIGIEDADDLIADLDQALSKATS